MISINDLPSYPLLDLVTDDVPEKLKTAIRDYGVFMQMGNDTIFMWEVEETYEDEEDVVNGLNHYLVQSGVPVGTKLLISYWW
jgi:hypothetical protein